VNHVRIKNVAAAYSVVVGLSMIAMWSSFHLTNAIPELKTEPIRVSFHIAAEVATGVCLIAGAFGLYRNKDWGVKAFLVSMGMLLYTSIVSPGYYAQRGVMEFVLMFAIITVVSVAFIAISFVKFREFNES